MRQNLSRITLILTLALTISQDAWAQWVLTSFRGSDAFAVSGSNLFAGLPPGYGVFLSTDNGDSWTEIDSNFQGSPIAACGTNLFASGEYGGVFLTTNNGYSWSAVNSGLPHDWDDTGYSGVNSFAVIGSNIFAGTYGTGVWLSTNNGISWGAINNGLTDTNVIAFVVSGSNLFAEANSSGFGGSSIYLTTDSGKTWKSVNSGLPEYASVASFAAFGSNLFASPPRNGVYLSTDSGTSWRTVNSGLPDHTTVNCFAVIGTDVFAGTDSNGVYLTTDSGTSWHSVNIGLTDSIVWALMVSGQYLVAGIYSNGVWRRPLSQMIPSSSSVTQTPLTSSQIQSYPNPFSQSTTVTFSSQSSGYAEVTVVNLLGAQVAQLFSGELGAGEHSFMWDATGMSPGMYECVVRMNGQMQQVSMVVTR